MKKSPIKVIVRLRPTSNFAHQQMNVDEQTGYIINDSVKYQCMFNDLYKLVLSTINKTNGDSNSKKSYLMHPKKSSIT